MTRNILRSVQARPAIGTIAGSLLVAGALFMGTAANVCAPEPAHLNGPLSANGSTAGATFVNSGVATTGFRWTGSWAVGSAPSGTPCATYAAPVGTLLMTTIQASGSYRRCL